MLALYSIENNLVALFKDKPSLELLAKALGKSFPCDNDSDTITIVNIWSNIDSIMYRLGETSYRLETIGFYE